MLRTEPLDLGPEQTNSTRGFLGNMRRALRSRWKLLVALVPLALLVAAACILIWPIDNADGPYPANAYRKFATPSSLSSLLNDDSLAGDSVYLNDVHLSRGPADDLYFARGASGNYLLVISAGSAASVPGKTAVADVKGIMRPLPSRHTLMHTWKMRKKQLARISGQQFYLYAQQIHVAH